jgi:hypothetical protein
VYHRLQSPVNKRLGRCAGNASTAAPPIPAGVLQETRAEVKMEPA